MKILVGVQANHTPSVLVNKALSWAPRAGFNIRLFVPPLADDIKYQKIVSDANYQHFLDLNVAMITKTDSPTRYAKHNNFDLYVQIPGNLARWNTTRDKDLMVLEYAADLATGRSFIAANPGVAEYGFANGVKMVRL